MLAIRKHIIKKGGEKEMQQLNIETKEKLLSRLGLRVDDVVLLTG